MFSAYHSRSKKRKRLPAEANSRFHGLMKGRFDRVLPGWVVGGSETGPSGVPSFNLRRARLSFQQRINIGQNRLARLVRSFEGFDDFQLGARQLSRGFFNFSDS